VEQYNAFENWVCFARGGTIYENIYEEQEKHVKYTSLLANCVILDNTIEISAVRKTITSPFLTHKIVS
jgi:TnpA family transposase